MATQRKWVRQLAESEWLRLQRLETELEDPLSLSDFPAHVHLDETYNPQDFQGTYHWKVEFFGLTEQDVRKLVAAGQEVQRQAEETNRAAMAAALAGK